MPSKKTGRETRLAALSQIPKFATGARVAAVFVVLIFVAAAMLMAARDPLPAATAPPKADPAPAAASATPMAKGETKAVTPVAITGCLEQKNDEFRLKNTEGEEAPKSRSWKSGFLKKGSATLSVVDPTSRLKLASHVGERVTVTGILEDREMKARTVKRVADCP